MINSFFSQQVGDRLFSALGQDTIDALFWTATEPKPNGRRKREHLGVLAHFLLTIVYVILHTLLVLLQATTLNVAINASNKALLTIMMSNNVRPFFLLFILMFCPQSVEYQSPRESCHLSEPPKKKKNSSDEFKLKSFISARTHHQKLNIRFGNQ